MEYIKTCLNCGCEFNTTQSVAKFCCTKCRKKYHSKTNGKEQYKRYIEKHGIEKRKEQVKKAAIKFQQKKSYKEYVSMKGKQYRDNKPKYSPVYFLICKGTGKLFTAKRKDAMYCKEYYNSDYYITLRRDKGLKREIKICSICGKEYQFYNEGTNSFCSNECRKESKRNIDRRRHARDKIRNRLATIETVNYIKVFDRDKWHCKLCGIKTPKELRGTYFNNAPELDHIIPLSKGGLHSYSNVQCLCRECNGNKSNRLVGQLKINV